uniref:Protealysin propeptide n=1 Tax=Myoviridae sp. ctIty1 TaxID=2827673 RepID=A0A8S5TG79_9CAUD|nr:MAG TPA: Protealysin propeptide [Myoviridae sp. ctIty1]
MLFLCITFKSTHRILPPYLLKKYLFFKSVISFFCNLLEISLDSHKK